MPIGYCLTVEKIIEKIKYIVYIYIVAPKKGKHDPNEMTHKSL